MQIFSPKMCWILNEPFQTEHIWQFLHSHKSWITCVSIFFPTFSLFYISGMPIIGLLYLLKWSFNFLIIFLLYCFFSCYSTFQKIYHFITQFLFSIFHFCNQSFNISWWGWWTMGWWMGVVFCETTNIWIIINFFLLCSLCCHCLLWLPYFFCFSLCLLCWGCLVIFGCLL